LTRWDIYPCRFTLQPLQAYWYLYHTVPTHTDYRNVCRPHRSLPGKKVLPFGEIISDCYVHCIIQVGCELTCQDSVVRSDLSELDKRSQYWEYHAKRFTMEAKPFVGASVSRPVPAYGLAIQTY
jgi:hypothetical protein